MNNFPVSCSVSKSIFQSRAPNFHFASADQSFAPTRSGSPIPPSFSVYDKTNDITFFPDVRNRCRLFPPSITSKVSWKLCYDTHRWPIHSHMLLKKPGEEPYLQPEGTDWNDPCQKRGCYTPTQWRMEWYFSFLPSFPKSGNPKDLGWKCFPRCWLALLLDQLFGFGCRQPTGAKWNGICLGGSFLSLSASVEMKLKQKDGKFPRVKYKSGDYI